MIRLLSSKLADFLCDKNIIPEDEKDIYVYGNELLISSFVGIFLVCVAGVILGEFLNTLAFLVVFIINRQFSGGYHANTFFKCSMVFMLVYLFVLFLSKILLSNYSLFIWLIVAFAHLSIIIDLAPMPNKYKPISDSQRREAKKKIIIISIIFQLVAAFVFFFDTQLSLVITLTLLSISMLMILQKTCGGEKDE